MELRLVCTDRSLEQGPGSLVAGNSYQIGRSSKCAFIVNDLSVSRLHAELTAKPDGAILKDLKSRNGTYVDGLRIHELEVNPGQTVRFGYALFQLVLTDKEFVDPYEISEVSTFIALVEPKLKPHLLGKLSGAEQRVFDQLLTGQPEKDVANALDISQHTVHNHIRAIYRKLNVNSRPELLAKFLPDDQKKA